METNKKLQIIYKHNKPYGIRDENGFLFFFADFTKYIGQEERYREEIEQQYKLADFLLNALQQKEKELLTNRRNENGQNNTNP